MRKIKSGDVVRFKRATRFLDGREMGGEYEVDGLVADAFGKLFVCLVDAPGCWPISKFVIVEVA